MVFCNMLVLLITDTLKQRHNPYFNRWFSAIVELLAYVCMQKVTILILIDGFLQFYWRGTIKSNNKVTILILIDGFLQSINCISLGGL